MRTRTIRRLPPVTREYAKLVNEVESIARRLKNRLAKIERLEVDLGLALGKVNGLESQLYPNRPIEQGEYRPGYRFPDIEEQ